MTSPRLVGMLHLSALPGTASWDGSLVADIAKAAIADALALQAAGFDGVMVQNSMDRPTRVRLDAIGVAQMAAVVTRVCDAVEIEVGVNVVKNDGAAAVAIAAAAGASFVRVKVLTGAVLSAEGIVSGCAEETHGARLSCGAAPMIWGDVYDPTSRALRGDDFDAAVADALDFGLADAVIVTGRSTQETFQLVQKVRTMRPGAMVAIGGGIDVNSVAEALARADAVIIGRALKTVPGIQGNVDMAKARALAEAARSKVAPGRGACGDKLASEVEA